MKHHILSRTLSLVSAAALSCTAVMSGSGLHGAAAQLNEKAVPQKTDHSQTADLSAQQEHSTGEPVSVIVKVAGAAALAQPDAAGMGSEYLESEAGAQCTAQCKAVQQAVQARIRQIYPALSVGFSYTALFNGFSCKLPADLIEDVRALPDVVSVIDAEIAEVPQMDRAAALSGFPAYYDMTGCSGEGQVIAVIDSELDTTHPMFAPLADDIQTALSREDVTEIINSGILNIDVDPEYAYISSKLPYVIDYANDDPYGGVPDSYSYHGTHVSGIAAGNSFTAGDGTTLSGIAKDAQIIFCACGEGNKIFLDSAMAAFEDAVKLHADIITMSWGAEDEYYGDSPYTEAVAAADNAGVVLFNAAGNSDNGTRNGFLVTPATLDSGKMSDKAELGSPIMMVASADNTGQSEAGMFLFEGDQIVYRPTMDYWGMLHYLSQDLAPGDYEYVYCGEGTSDDFSGNDVEGKIVLVQRTAFNNPDLIAMDAREFGAVGVILIDRDLPDGMDYVLCDEVIQCALITYAEGQRMIEAENKTVTFTGENVLRDYPKQVSYYSSWGVKHSLDLRPDIMGIGGRVKSADYDSSYETASGTSMATPYVAGCAAVIRQYLMQQGITLTGSELTAYIRSLMMNSAIPYEENGVFVTPRQQGAGLVSLDRAVSAKVLMTGSSGDAKVNLFDNIGSSFTFDVTLTNSSSEDVVFADSALRLTTDNVFYDSDLSLDILRGQQALNCTTNFSGPVSVAAGQSVTIPVQVSLDAAQYAQLHEKFLYGFFIEGYLMLSGAENSSDVSIPLLGFSDDWAQLPIVQPNRIAALADAFISGVPLVEYYGILRDVTARAPKKELNLVNYATDEERQLLEFGRNEAWISPNGDGLMDEFIGMILLPARRFAKAVMELTDSDGNVIWSKPEYMLNPLSSCIDEFNSFDQTALEEGEYTLSVKTWIDYPGSAEHPQVYSCKVIVDKTTPEVSGDVIERDGRKILSVTASDDRQLQGAAVFGHGQGGTVGTYDPDTYDKDWWYYEWDYIGLDYNFSMNNLVQSWLYNYRVFPDLWHSTGLSDPNVDMDWDFLDFAPFTENADGTFTMEYDITDLTDYTFLVLDNAYNAVEFHSDDKSAEELVQQKGVWEDDQQGLYEITDDGILFRSFYTGETTAYSVTAQANQLTLVSGSETRSFTVRRYADGVYRMIDNESGKDIQIIFREKINHLDDQPFHPINEMMALGAADSAAVYGKEAIRTEFRFILPVSFNVVLDENEEMVTEYVFYQVDLYTGRGFAYWRQYDPVSKEWTTENRDIIFYEEPLTDIPAGLYTFNYNGCFRFNGDGTGKVIYDYVYDSSLLYGDKALADADDQPFTYTIDADSYVVMTFPQVTLSGRLMRGDRDSEYLIALDNDSKYELRTQYGVFRLITDDPDEIAKLHTSAELKELSRAYISAVKDETPENLTAGGFVDQRNVLSDSGFEEKMALSHGCFVSVGASFGECLYTSDTYYMNIDPFTLKGYDRFHNPVDLTNPPQLPENAYNIEELENMARNDYIAKTGESPDHVGSFLLPDGSVYVLLESDEDGMLDQYTVDPVTGTGTNEEGETVDLPQTGSNDPASYRIAVLALLTMTAGLACCGIGLRRKKDSAVTQ